MTRINEMDDFRTALRRLVVDGTDINWSSCKVILDTIRTFKIFQGYGMAAQDVGAAILHRIDQLGLYGGDVDLLHQKSGRNIVKTMAVVMAQNHGLQAITLRNIINNSDGREASEYLGRWCTTIQQFIRPEHLNDFIIKSSRVPPPTRKKRLRQGWRKTPFP